MTDKTHYRKAFDSPYLSAADIVDPVVLTVRRVVLEKDKTKKTQDHFNTAYWEEAELRPGEKLKPMILNSTNSKAMAILSGSKWIDDWAGLSVTVFVDPNVRFGKETVEGLRISKATERPQGADPAMVEQGDTKAKEGEAALRAFWEGLTEAQRQTLMPRLRGWKAVAKGAKP
jgi:hypothetical protein